MARHRQRPDEPTLFDLPLGPPAEETDDAAPPPPDLPAGAPLDEPVAGARGRPRSPAPPTPPAAAPEEPNLFDLDLAPEPLPLVASPRGTSRPAPLGARAFAGLVDLGLHLVLGMVLLFGARLLGVGAGLDDWPPVLLFLIVFSFFYAVLPLAFWGKTPGMAWAGLVARAGGETLTFAQSVRRWAGGLATLALAGLPVLLAAGGRRSLADRLSDSDTFTG